jgi:3'(2'), 5'-bisphosphate nucleotidase
MSDDADLEALIDIAREASARVAELYAEHVAGAIAVEMKRPGDPVTVADKEANQLICAALAARFPGAGVVAEESAPTPTELAALGVLDRVFFVDPLDGTREFVDRVPEFAVMIGLAEGGRATAGVVATPHDGRIAAGRVGAGAFVIAPDGARTPLQVTGEATFANARMVVSRSHRPALIAPLCKRLGISGLVPCGSVGVKVLRLAEGAADLYVHGGPGLKLWDTCAPEAILAAAGGRVTNLDGARLDYGQASLQVGRGFCATNGALHAGVLSAVGWAEREAERLRKS